MKPFISYSKKSKQGLSYFDYAKPINTNTLKAKVEMVSYDNE